MLGSFHLINKGGAASMIFENMVAPLSYIQIFKQVSHVYIRIDTILENNIYQSELMIL